MAMSSSKLQEMVRYREAGHAAIHGVAKSLKQLCDWTATYAEGNKEKIQINLLTEQKQSHNLEK